MLFYKSEQFFQPIHSYFSSHSPACEPGQYCGDTGSPTTSGDCMEGFYCTVNATKANPTDGETGNECPIGHYCPKGSHAPTACANGTFMNMTGAFF